MDTPEERLVWVRRLRWRLRGALQWPAFLVFTVVDAVLLQLLPLAGDHGPGIVATLILAGVLNLLMVAVVGPLAAAWLRRRDGALPAFAARDRAGALAVAGLSVLLLVGGVLHAPSVSDQRSDLRAQARAAQRYFLTQAPAVYRRNIAQMNTWKAGPRLYRTCVPGADPRRELCVYVTTDQSPPGVSRDASQEPNSSLAGPDDAGYRVR